MGDDEAAGEVVEQGGKQAAASARTLTPPPNQSPAGRREGDAKAARGIGGGRGAARRAQTAPRRPAPAARGRGRVGRGGGRAGAGGGGAGEGGGRGWGPRVPWRSGRPPARGRRAGLPRGGPADPAPVIAAERAFSAKAAEAGIGPSFLAFMADGAIVFNPD